MKLLTVFLWLFLFSTSLQTQQVSLFDFNISVRKDTANWHKDFFKINSDYSREANKCQTCMNNQKGEINSRFCTNTTRAHVKLDSTYYHASPELLKGKWEIVNAGVVEITDTMKAEFKISRTERISIDKSDLKGSLEFLGNKVQFFMDDNGKIFRKNQTYQILNNRFFMTKKLFNDCGPSVIGITKTGYLIIDQYSYEESVEKDKFWTFKTFISRTILKKV